MWCLAGKNHSWAMLKGGNHRNRGLVRGQNALRIAIRSALPEIQPIFGSGLWNANRTQMGPTDTIYRGKRNNTRQNGVANVLVLALMQGMDERCVQAVIVCLSEC